MKTATITLEDEVYLLCFDLIKQRQLSSTINELLRNFLNVDDNEFFQKKESLMKEKEEYEDRLKKISTKLVIMKQKEEEAKKKAKQQTLQTLKGMRKNNPLRKII